jgi:glycosyltransferase 2 family protein
MTDTPMFSKKKTFFLLKLAVAAGLVALLVRNVDWAVVGEEFSEASLPLIFLAFGFYCAGMLISVRRWQATARFKKFDLSFRDAVRFHFGGLFLNNFLPSFLGGDAYRSYLLGNPEKRYSAAVSTVIFVRFVGLWSTIVLFLSFGLISFDTVFSQPMFALFGIGLAAFFAFDVALTLFFDRKLVQKFVGIFPGKLRNFFHEIGGFTDRKFVWESFLVSLLFSFVGVGLFNFALFSAFGESVPIIPYLSVVFLTSFVSSLPLSVNNIGLKEWSYFTFFPLIGISPEAALAVALLGRFLQMFASLFGAPFFFRNRPGPMKDF